jgi:hypothetical protein
MLLDLGLSDREYAILEKIADDFSDHEDDGVRRNIATIVRGIVRLYIKEHTIHIHGNGGSGAN